MDMSKLFGKMVFIEYTIVAYPLAVLHTSGTATLLHWAQYYLRCYYG